MANSIRSINDVTILDLGAFAGLVLIVVDSSWLAFFIYMVILIGFHLEKRFGLIGRKLSSKTKNSSDKNGEAKDKEIKVSDNLEKVGDFSKERKESQESGVLHETTKSVAVDNDDVEDDACSTSRKLSGDCVAEAQVDEIKHEASPREQGEVEKKDDDSMLSKVKDFLSRKSSESSVSSAESEDHKEDFVKVSAEIRSDESLEKSRDNLIDPAEESTKRLQKLYEDRDESVSNRLDDITDDLTTPTKDDRSGTFSSEKEEHATATFQGSTIDGRSQESSLEPSINLDGPKVNDDDEDRSLSSSSGTGQTVSVETKEIKVSTEHSEKEEITSVGGVIHISDQGPEEAVTDVHWQRFETEHVVSAVAQSNSDISVTNQSKFVTNGEESNAQLEAEKDGHSSRVPGHPEEEQGYEESY